MDKKVETAQDVIANLRCQYGIRDDGTQAEDKQFMARGYKNAIEQLSTGLYEKEVHFILELIQNAEDNQYEGGVAPDLRFIVLEDDPTHTPGSDGCLCVFNNETGFEKQHVESISQIGESTKKKIQGYIGEKGIGFKSVFIVSCEPHIYSNDYRFQFKENDPDIALSYIVPYWLDSVPNIVRKDNANTAILLPLKPGKKAAIIADLKRIKPETILFLSRLDGLSVDIRAESLSVDLIRDRSKQPITELLVQENGKDIAISGYWLYSHNVDVPDGLNEEKRAGVKSRPLTVAFPLNKSDISGTIYAFLPTEVDSGLPFLINADFILTANRESIQPDREWNIWLRDALAELIVKGLSDLSENDEYRHLIYGFIPLVEDIQTLKNYLAPVCKNVHKQLAAMETVLTDQGEFTVPSSARLATKQVRQLFGGKKRCTAFDEFNFVDERLEKHTKRLKAIGVTSFNNNDMKACLSDTQWLDTRDNSWFLRLYEYLRESVKATSKYLQKIPIIPTKGGGLVSSSMKQVYFPASVKSVKTLDKRLSVATLPAPDFIDDAIFISLSSNKVMLGWVRENLKVEDFSFSTFIGKTLVPWLYDNANQIDEKCLLAAVGIILDGWQEIEEDDRNILGKKLPLLLDSGEIVCPGKFKGVEVLVPRALDKDLGWQRILQYEEDYKHEDVLSDKYISLIDGRELLDEFFGKINTQKYPHLCDYSGKRYGDFGRYGDYFSEKFNQFKHKSTSDVELSTWITPTFFHNDAKRKNKKNRLALLSWLQGMLGSKPESLGQGKISWFYHKSYYTNVESGLLFYLTKTDWINTTKGLKRPGEVFKKTKQINEMFGNRLPYLNHTISPELCDFLGIKTEVTTETVLDYLRELSKEDDVDFRLIKQLYKYLDDYGEGYADSFVDEALIYIPESKKRWYLAEEVIWDDAAQILGDLYGWLSSSYDTSGLKRFFLDDINVSESVQNEELARAWLQLQARSEIEPDNIKSSLSKIYPKLLQVAKDPSNDEAWWEGFVDDALVWTQADDFLSGDQVYIADDTYFRKLFNNRISFVWRPEASTYNSLKPLCDSLGVRSLSGSVEASLDNSGEASLVETPSFLTPYSKQLLCYMIYNKYQDKYEELESSGLLKNLLQTVESTTEALMVRYSVTAAWVEETVTDKYAFWQPDCHLLYLNSRAESDDLFDDVVEVISRALWGSDYKNYEDRVRTTLAISSEKRFKKIRDKKGWHLPSKVNRLVKSLISESAPLISEEASEPSDGSKQTTEVNVVDDELQTGEFDGGNGTIPVASELQEPAPDENEPERPHTQPVELPKPNRGNGRSAPSVGRTGLSSPPTSHGAPSRTPVYASGSASSVRGGRPRSAGIASSVNQARRNRMRSYVASELCEDDDLLDGAEAQQIKKELGEQGELEVLNHLRAKGWDAHRMPENNPGYDIEATHPNTGEVLFIEVKGESFQWCDKGVGISSKQFETASVEQNSYLLAVVENLRSASREISFIRDPVSYISEYRFDDGWRALTTKLTDIAANDNERELPHERLIKLTDNSNCQQLIGFSHENDFPLPDVGLELQDDQGRVIGELEIAWEQERIGVALTPDEIQGVISSQGWAIYGCDDVDLVKAHLHKTFNHETGCDD